MAQGIQDLGTVGYLYKTAPDGTTIITTERNTVDGVRAMQQQGTSNAPVVAARSAVGKITVSSVASAGSITNIDIAAVNQIGANIVVTSSTASVVATQIATAINAFTPASGDNYTAQAVGAVVSVFSSASNGSAANGLTITVSVTDITIVTTTTAFTNGSSQIGVYDTTFGYRFYINANYNGDAVPTSLTNAVEITEYMTVRGLQSGIMTVSATVATDRITGLSRSCAITQIIVDTESSAASDVLAFIQTEGFVEGDSIRLRALDTGRITTLEDATVTTSPIGTKNIYLTDAQSYALAGLVSIALQLRNDPTLGLCWIETSRSIANSVTSLTRSAFNTLLSASALVPGTIYLITDIGDAGTYVLAMNTDSYNATGTLARRIPTGYASCWRADMTAPTINIRYRYYQNVYQSVTGAIGTAPDTDTVNWLLIAKSNVTYYATEYHEVGVDTTAGYSIMWERDLANNFVSQSTSSRSALGDAFNAFAWQLVTVGSVYGNSVIDSIFDCANSDGTVYQNTTINDSNFSGNRLQSGSIVRYNLLNNGGVTDNYVDILSNCIVEKGGIIIQNGGVGAYFYSINKCTVQGGIGYNVSATAGNKSIFNCRVEGQIQYNTLYTDSSISNVYVENGSTCSSGTYRGSLLNATVRNASFLTITQAVAGSVSRYLTLETSTVNITFTSNFTLSSFYFKACTIQWTMNANSLIGDLVNFSSTFTGSINASQISNFTTSGTPTFVFSNDVVVGNESSTMAVTLDLDTGILASNILTIPSNAQLAGVFNVTGTGAKDIQQVSGLPLFKEVRFINISLGASAVTFTKVVPGAWAVNNIVGAATFVLEQDASGASDMLVMSKLRGVQNTIIQTVKLA
jgi:hypothetical protein